MRPSELLDVPDSYTAYCLDSAVGEFGRTVENELKSVEGKTKKEIEVKSDRLLRKWLDMPAQYRDPVRAGVAKRPTKGGE